MSWSHAVRRSDRAFIASPSFRDEHLSPITSKSTLLRDLFLSRFEATMPSTGLLDLRAAADAFLRMGVQADEDAIRCPVEGSQTSTVSALIPVGEFRPNQSHAGSTVRFDGLTAAQPSWAM